MRGLGAERSRTLAGEAVITIACLISFAPALRAGFIWDDDRHVTQNRALRSGHGLSQIWTNPDTEPQYYPLSHTSFWIDFHIFGLRPFAYHLENILLHAAVAIALWQLLKRLDVSIAFPAAMLFALHPLQAETVVWISERKNLLSALFEMFALIVYLPLAFGKWSWPRYLAAFALFAAAMLSKTVACTMPAVILVLIWWKRGQIRRRDVLPTLPMFAVSIALSLITAHQEVVHVGAAGADWNLSLVQRILIAGRGIWFYAMKIIWPTNLAFIYPRWKVRADEIWQYLFAITAIASVASLLLLRRRIGRGPTAAALIFAGVLAPALGFVNTYPMRYSFVADHFQYTAGIALIVLLAALIRRRIVLAAIAVVLAIITFRHAGIFHDPETLWRETIAKNPDCWMARSNLGVLLTDSGRPAEALREFDAVAVLRPDHPQLAFNRAEAMFRLSRWNQAIDLYRAGLAGASAQTDQTRAVAHDRIGQALLRLSRADDARREFGQATSLDPKFAEAKLHLAQTFEQLGEVREAMAQYRGYLALRPQEASTHAWLGVLYGRAGEFDLAVEEFSRALDLDPNLAAAKDGLRMALTMQRRSPPATLPH